jgi:hypothetical protein
MPRSRLVLVIAVVVVAALAAGGIIAAVRKSGPSSPQAGAERVIIGVSAGSVTPRAAQIALGGNTYPVQPGPGGTRRGPVTLTADAGGVAVVHDRAGHVLATAPVWSVPGQPPQAAEATCDSTAFDQFLLTPGVTGPNPVAVDVLWSLAQQGQTGRDVAALGRLICAGLAHDPAHLAHPSQAEISAYGKIYLDYATQLPRLAAQMPSLSSSLVGIRAAAGGPSAPARTSAWRTAGGTAVMPVAGRAAVLTAARRLLDSSPDECADGLSAVATAAGSSSPVALCSDGRDVNAENDSAAWAFLYGVPAGQGGGSGIPQLPLTIVPGRTSDFPSLGTILGAVIHDDALGVKKGGCALLGLAGAHPKTCQAAKKPGQSAVAALFNLAEPGEATAHAAAGYYSIGWGDGQGDQNTFPAGTTPAQQQTEQRYSEDLTFISSVIVPTIGLILDKQLDPKNNLLPDQLPLLLPVFNELAGSALQLGVNGAPRTVTGQLRAVADTAKTLFENPNLLADIFIAFALPNFGQVSHDLAEKLIKYLVSLEVPVAGWTVLLVQLVTDGASAATLVLSLAGMFDALTQPSYSSWTPELTADAAFQLPLFTPSAAVTCPAPAAPVAIPPGAPAAPSCEWVVQADLNGNGKPDRLVTWQAANQRGAVAYLDDGSVHPLQNGSATEANSTAPWASYLPDNGETNQPMRVMRAGQSARQQVLLIDYEGAVGDDAVLTGLGTDGSLRLVMTGDGHADSILTAANLGCANQSGQRLFVEGALGRGEPGGQSASVPGYGVSRSFFQLSGDLHLRLVGYQGQVVASAPPSDPYHNFCPAAGDLPAAGPLDPWADSAQQALIGLVAAAVSKDQTRADAFLAGGYADFSGNGHVADMWQYLTATPELNPNNWANRAAVCTSSAPGDATCHIIGANGEPLSTEEAQAPGGNWVVTGGEAG